MVGNICILCVRVTLVRKCAHYITIVSTIPSSGQLGYLEANMFTIRLSPKYLLIKNNWQAKVQSKSKVF